MQIQSTDMNWDQCSSVKTFVLCNENGKLFRITKSLFFLRIIYSFEWLISAQYKLLSDILDIHDKNLHINFRLPSIQGGFMNSNIFIIKVLSNRDIIHFQNLLHTLVHSAVLPYLLPLPLFMEFRGRRGWPENVGEAENLCF